MSTVTILTAKGSHLLTKSHKRLPSGDVETTGYGKAVTFTARVAPFRTITDLAGILDSLSTEPYRCIVRADLRDGANPFSLNRKLKRTANDAREPDLVANLEGKRWVKLDLDSLAMPHSDGLEYQDGEIVGISDPVTVVRAVIATYLPPYFQGVSVYYAFSASAGVKPWNEVRLGLYYVLDRPIPDKVLARWAKRLQVVDPAVFTPNQCNYTAAPIFHGMRDPCAGWRSGLIELEHGELSIPERDLAEPVKQRPPAREQRDPEREPNPKRERAYVLAALDSEAAALKSVKEGNRHLALRDAAYALGGYVRPGLLEAHEVEDSLYKAATANGLVDDDGEAKVRDVLERALAAGAEAPRELPPERPQGKLTLAPDAPSTDDDDDERSVKFEDLLERVTTATINDLPSVFMDMRYLADSGARNAQRDAIFKALKEATGVGITALKRDYAASQAGQEEPERETLAQQLLGLVLEAGVLLWHDPDGEPYITLTLESHQEHHRLKTQAVKRWVQRLWYEETGGTIGREPLSEALGVLEGKAIHDGEQHETFIRVAELGEGADATIYIDMGDPHWHAIEVNAGGWRVINSAATPVRFIRSGGMLALPTPQPGTVADIAAALGIPHLDPQDDTRPYRPFQGAVAWLLQAFRVRGPFPILPLFGQQGAGKTTFTKRLCWLLDPHSATLRVLSRDDRDILIAARHSWLQAKDNVSTLSQWTSDAFCRLATGGAISTRTLYTDGEETILNAKRPLLLNGITNFLEQQDLVDRAIVVSLPAIPEDQRQPESELEAAYERQRPKALGALLDVVATGLSRGGERHLERLPRMADFAEWIVACSPALGWDAEDFLEWYASTKTDLVREALDASPIVPYLLQLIRQNPEGVEMQPSELLAELNTLAGLTEGKKRAPHGWPKRAQSLTNELKRLKPALLAAEGIEIEQEREKSARKWTLRKVGKSSSSSSPRFWTREKARAARENPGDDDSTAHRHPSSPVVTSSATVTMAPEASSPEKARPTRHRDDDDDDDDGMPTLRGAHETKTRNATPPEVKRLYYLWKTGVLAQRPEHEELTAIFKQPHADADARARLIELAGKLTGAAQ